MKKLLQSTRGKTIAAVTGVIVVLAVLFVFLSFKEESYRSIAVDNLCGTTLISSEKTEEKEAYKGMHLYSGDSVDVQNESNLTLCMDGDKYVYAEENTKFKVESTDNEVENKLVICLTEGAVINRLKKTLEEGESYTVETPNATMGVRGTVFRVTVDSDEKGLNYARVEVFDGSVQVDLKKANGDYNGLSATLGPGESVLIRGNAEFAEFVVGEDGKDKQEITYKQIPQDVAQVLIQYIDDGEELCIGKELLMDYTKLAEHKIESNVRKEATCTEDGYKEIKCVVCDEVTEIEVLPATGHTLSDWKITQESTCLNAGKQTRTCDVCKTYFEEEDIPALGHLEGELVVTKDADCTNEGVQTATCTRCGEVVKEVKSEALGHSYGSPVTVDATCTTDGSTTITCSQCGAKSVSVILATEHQMRKIHDNFIGDGTGISTGVTCRQICRVCRTEIATPCSLTLIDDIVNAEGVRVITYSCGSCGVILSTSVL